MKQQTGWIWLRLFSGDFAWRHLVAIYFDFSSYPRLARLELKALQSRVFVGFNKEKEDRNQLDK